jgi:hypothetical protein
MFPQRAGEVGARRLVVSNGAEVKPDAPFGRSVRRWGNG